ncbi:MULTISPECIES: hypothetical protein [Priestia]|uniref:hypothetical protein n=1 Tax=Priestia TaxID=2800373 RepID=UPI001C8F0F5C|nr:hypothetical protein [Priestia aryabhattai]MBY0213523.1 hypothetical protein [Priestia aryabhattai]MDT0148394.1 hypothetical protein [Priestia aryabhattai]MDT0153740.1 hypothetical protein [Priestia aryabhattai]
MILSARKTILCIVVAFSVFGIKPNFTYAAISNAVPIEVNKTYNGTLHEGEDEGDFYKFSLTIDGNVTLSMKQKQVLRGI